MCGVPLAVVGAMLGHKHDRTTQRYAHLANDVVRNGLEAATDRIVGATRAVVMLEPPPFERLTDRECRGRDGPSPSRTRTAPRTDPGVRNYRTGLLPRVPDAEAFGGKGMLGVGFREPRVDDLGHPRPGQGPQLIAASQRLEPEVAQLPPQPA